MKCKKTTWEKITKCKWGMVMIVALTAGIAGSSKAESVSAFLGQPQAPGDYSCFTNSMGTVTNVCSTTRRFCTALTANHNTNTISVTVYAPNSSHNIGCFAQAVYSSGSGAGWTGMQYPGTMGSHQTVTLGSLFVPSYGGLYVCCDIAPTAKLDSISWW